MERLTEKLDKMIWFKDQGLKIEPCEMNAHHCRMILEKLADYEDLEEQGLLVRLPCKVGEKLWCIVNSTIRELRVHHFDMSAFGITDIVFRYADGFKLERFAGEIGKTVFPTHEEAEKKLEEMKK
jgi:hypothetical protein